ncbi:hypothetical protein KSP39_PZI004551 [Platanthera zijinensis]|uniref:Dirigent protein n=1 Tax=Platanthera zijinensis TaxID=2320716 RepID=A0AAP0GD28_9ASPA
MATIKTLLLISIMAISTAAVTSMHDGFFEKPAKTLEKYTHIHLYTHILVHGPNSSAVKVVQGPTKQALGFGEIVVADNPLTEGPDLSSKLLGREQAVYIGVSQDYSKASSLVTANLVFTAGEHKESTITIVGREPLFNFEREMTVVGGTGAFRLARGYYIRKVHTLNPNGNIILEGDIYVFHY